MKRRTLAIALIAAAAGLAAPRAAAAGEKLTVVASLPTFRSIAELIGGDRVDAFSIATGYQNPHFVDPKPSYIRRLSKADLFITTGLDLETGWAPSLLQSSRNGKIQPGSEGYVDASEGISLLQIPTSGDRSQGDIHLYGNPHYWMDPLRGKQIAATITGRLSRLSPADADYFAGNLKLFNEEIDRRTASLQQKLSALRGAPLVAYHNEWPYLEERFGFHIVEFLEPKPGIPPTPGQLLKVISAVRTNNVRIVITSPYFTLDAAELVSRQTGARIAVLATSVGAFEGVDDYYDLFEYNADVLLKALSPAPGE
jgi:ABC-type Zn uptake system ZnuABC Zn-binding protein ZnuA